MIRTLSYASHYNLREFSFCSAVVNIWNSLPDSVVDADTINTFKSRLDKHSIKSLFIILMLQFVCDGVKHRGPPAPVCPHWIGLNYITLFHNRIW